MRLCNETVTVINRRYNSDEAFTEYKTTVINGASWYGSLKSTVDANGLKAANQYVVRIPTSANFNGKAYCNPIEYAGMSSVDGVFTLANGDLIVRGVVREADSDISPKTIHDSYPDVLTILSVSDDRRYRQAPHWKVVGA